MTALLKDILKKYNIKLRIHNPGLACLLVKSVKIKNMKKKIFALSLLVSFAATAQEKNNPNVSMFPKPEIGYKQVVIGLSEKQQEENYKIELFAGRMVGTDECNRYFLSGEIKEENLEGWGYTYYTFSTNGSIGSTMMACPDAKREEKFVTAPGMTIRYNSKLPVVIYVPNDYEIRYKIWETGNEMQRTKVNM